MEQRHGEVTRVGRTQFVLLREHLTGEQHHHVSHLNRFGITAGSRGEDHHEGVGDLRLVVRDKRSRVALELGPLRRVRGEHPHARQ